MQENIIKTMVLKKSENLKKCVPQKTCHQSVNTLATSTLDYDNVLLVNLLRATLRLLQMVQNRAAKTVLHYQLSHYNSSTEARETSLASCGSKCYDTV